MSGCIFGRPFILEKMPKIDRMAANIDRKEISSIESK